LPRDPAFVHGSSIVKTTVLPRGALDIVKRSPRLYQLGRRLRMAAGSRLPPRRVDGVPGRVHFNDFMLRDTSPEAVERYQGGAVHVVELLEASLLRSGRGLEDVSSWLDYGCGYGRVLRTLREHVNPSSVFAADVISECVSFCASEFGVQPIYVDPKATALALPSVDVVYSISVLTHMPPEQGNELLRSIGNAVAEGGTLLFTTHGERSLETIGRYGEIYEPLGPALREQVERTGVAFVPYRHYPGDDYGMTWHSPDYVKETVAAVHGPALELVLFEPHGLDGHQDVFAYTRRGAGPDAGDRPSA
jgi:SAM-dependent methyltransferase